MKVAILAGGLGSRLQEETIIRPKPMVEIGGKPILWHIMSHYAAHGFKEFTLALGYKGDVIKDYFLDFYALNSDFTVDLFKGERIIHQGKKPDWKVDLVDTGLNTLTGGRIQRLRPWLAEGTFMVTYGDGVSNVSIKDLLAFHQSHGKIATLTAVHPPARFGAIEIDGKGQVTQFVEKPLGGDNWINGGFFVLEPAIFDYLDGDDMAFEWKPMERLAADGQLMAFRHEGFFQPMDTLRDRRELESLWTSGRAPWKVWE